MSQQYSCDLYLRMRADDLDQLEFTHLCSDVLTMSRERPVCGYTEWTAVYSGATISLAWDWVLQNDGALMLSEPQHLRSNIMVVTDKGYDLGPEGTAACCATMIETMPWRAAVLDTLRGGCH